MRKRTRATIGSLALAIALTLSVGGEARADSYWQCVPFARMISGIELFGDAWTWWRQAAGKYAQGFTPKAGAVLVFKPNGVMTKGHVAVVSQVLTDRIIQVTHANWSLIGGSRGQVEKDVTVVDVSAAGDWSVVKVWYDPSRDLGSTTYPTYGFIYQSPTGAAGAAAQNTMRTMTQSAMSQLASLAPNPGGDPRQMASGPTDRIAALIASVTGGGDDHSDVRKK
jgi:surface antigen